MSPGCLKKYRKRWGSHVPRVLSNIRGSNMTLAIISECLISEPLVPVLRFARARRFRDAEGPRMQWGPGGSEIRDSEVPRRFISELRGGRGGSNMNLAIIFECLITEPLAPAFKLRRARRFRDRRFRGAHEICVCTSTEVLGDSDLTLAIVSECLISEPLVPASELKRNRGPEIRDSEVPMRFRDQRCPEIHARTRLKHWEV
jgi:hypothetical protein